MLSATCRRSLRNLSRTRVVLNGSPPSVPPTPKGPRTRWFGLVAAAFIGGMTATMYASYNILNNTPEFLFPQSSTTALGDCVPPMYGDPQKLIACLRDVLKEDQISVSASEMNSHSDSYFSTDHPHPEERPDAVVYPTSTEEVSQILKLAHEHRVPITPYSGGTSLEGHYIPTRRGICVDLSRMGNIVEIHPNDLDVVVQPAVMWEDLRDYLHDYGLLFGPDPGPGACIGGMIGTSCSGTNAARYGTMRENVISLTVVLADGTIVKTKRRPRKSACGYNLTNLIIGSEGTLGIVTEATLRLHVIPKVENVAIASFPDLKGAASAVEKLVRSGIPVNALELLDGTMMKFVNQSDETTNKYEELPTLMLKIGGSSNKVADAITKDVKDICHEAGCGRRSFRFASSEEEKLELWTARKVALWSTIDAGRKVLGPDAQVWTTDVAVPISRLVESLALSREEFDRENVLASIVSHAGDGNYHALIMFKEEDRPKIAGIVRNMVSRALEMEGTATGEHGVGIGKREFLLEELGPDSVNMMRKVKLALDPLRIMNPDKVFQVDPLEPRGGSNQ